MPTDRPAEHCSPDSFPAVGSERPALAAKRLVRLAVLGGAAVGLAGVAELNAGTTWLSRWSSVVASVGFGDGNNDAERRGTALLDPADLAASADVDLGVDDFAGDFIGGGAAATQTSTLNDDGLKARLGIDVFAGEGDHPISGREAIASGSVLLRTTFALDAPATFTFFPLGSPGMGASSSAGGFGATSAGSATLAGEGLEWTADLTDGFGELATGGMPITGDLPAGTYSLRYELSAEALAGSVAFDVPVDLTFGPAEVMADGSMPLASAVAVVPLPSAGWAGLATGGLTAAGSYRLRRRSRPGRSTSSSWGA